MGFPTEIPNSFPEHPPVPVEEPVTAFLIRVWSFLTAPFRRRKTTAGQKQGHYAQGVSQKLPRVQPGDSVKLDFEDIERDI